MRMRHSLLLLCALASVQVSYRCGTLSTVGARFVSDSQEVALGEEFHRQIVDDPQFPLYTEKVGFNQSLVSYVENLGQTIARSQNDRPDIEYYFTLIDNDTAVNAFAVPGGYIYLYTGLIKAVRNEAELAGVIGHELGHITKRHGVKLMIQQRGYDFALDILVGDSSLARTALDIAGGLTFLKYSRDNEYEADSLAVVYTADAGFNPTGMKTFLQLLAAEGEPVFEKLSTHPASSNRIEDVEKVLARQPAGVLNLPLGEGEIPRP